MKRAAETPSVTVNKVVMEDGSFPESSPPSSHFALGSQKYAVVAPFLGSFKVHIRQYAVDESFVCRPSKVGVVMSPYAWECFSEKAERFDIDEVLVCERELVVSAKFPQLPECHRQMDRQFQHHTVQLQRMFQRSDGGHQFAPAFITLTSDEFQTLVDVRKKIGQSYREQFFGRLFRSLVRQVVERDSTSSTPTDATPPDLFQSLVNLFKTEIDGCIMDIFRCHGCRMGYENQLGHECVTSTPIERFAIYFDRAMARLNLKNFVTTVGAQHITQSFLSNVNYECIYDALRDLYSDVF